MQIEKIKKLKNPDHWRRIFYRIVMNLKKPNNLESNLDDSIEQIYSPKYSNNNTQKTLRILYVAMKYDYDNPRRGLSFEENNFFHSLQNMGHEIIRFDYPSIMRRFDRKKMNKLLLETVYRYNPDLMFTALFTEEFDKKVIQEITNDTDTVTFNWFCDDQWRFDTYSKYWAPTFNWVVSTAKSAIPRYKEIGYKNVIYSQYACNHFLYRKLNLPYLYDVTFVGQPHGNRREVINKIKKAGIDVKTLGYGWKEGRVSQTEMIKIFNQSKINLNLSNASTNNVQQIKGRDFEVPGCGGFMITSRSEELSQYYNIDKEVVCYNDTDDLIDKIKYFLQHEEERKKIAKAGYIRTLKDHTYEKRFSQIFKKVGLI